MTLVSNDPSWWPLINGTLISSYFIVAASAAVMYDWALTFAQEVELVWRQRWSLMTILYLCGRYLGIIYAVVIMLGVSPEIRRPAFQQSQRQRQGERGSSPAHWGQYNDHHSCFITYLISDWMGVVVEVSLGVIMITRLHAMYQRSRKVLILVVVIFLSVNITCGVIVAITMRYTSVEELILSGTYQCIIHFEGNAILHSMPWILGTVWEVLALCLAVCIALKHFRELRRQSSGGIMGDLFTVLMKTHVVYFASFVAVSCFQLSLLFPTISANPYSLEAQIYTGVSQVFMFVQMFVLGPRLILGVREYHAKIVADSDAATAMTSIVFQQRVHVSTSSSV
ncbi:uncharacterized protein EDB91DRAFT_1273467 [Suillus paluster]|uniref:uncharacterized protein n=1 Tax=Suillus paluster TaxID=48578 RepID=UPI001B86E18D|nr:uncharacterized protein EDB91DRAFT_1273467 [Suillus paluster]KAG1743998.1 hypothetical protein EDB91DRAFT_1273467 [Suillus paluster]